MQNSFHGDIVTYINGGKLSKLHFYLSVIAPQITFSLYAKKIINKYVQLKNELPEKSKSGFGVKVEPYEGQNRHVSQMATYLDEHVRHDLIGAYIHGSLGSCEAVSYSDFDALVILKDAVFESPERLAKVARRLYCARTIMMDYDPLQHHGWFVLTELDLKCLCSAYFPPELFKYAKSMFKDKGLKLEISSRESLLETRMAFEMMADAIIRKIDARRYPANMYQLKGLLSEYMLLPALYVQARDGRGIYKRESFASAKADFSSTAWEIMDQVSEIRTLWKCDVFPMKRRMMIYPHVLSRYYAKRFAPSIPQNIHRILDVEFYSRMKQLALLMKETLA